ncbi:hypothetical protein SeMB42_g03182 [Synchytrium endobioticum]|uniref:Uncharacterized protein n=1 Tax=Synchytrium endobioticum TaxID=286115 RepID=A0A507CXV8_9FUNG|nr:hypothetical protein SeLEV6574_g04741 [Synchytrium endobioticum]TPX47839.1 hypothetical protein SeMB42_g03182 [Synchytrium endobioticum]
MSMFRSIIGAGENAFRRSQVAHRMYWQREGDRPTYIRGSGDSATFFIAAAGVLGLAGLSVGHLKKLIRGK